MSIFESLIVSLFCMAFVFFVLAVLFCMVRILTGALGMLKARKIGFPGSGPAIVPAAAEPADTAADGFSSGTLKLLNVDERTAAMIMAIVSHESGIPLSGLCFKSIKAVEES